jgi:hypothetical protein
MRWALWLMFAVGVTAAGVRADEGVEFFESRVRPVLVEKCFGCHSSQAKKLKGGLRLDSREGVLKGGDSGAAIVVGAPEKSRLIEAISYKNVDLSMPPKEKLSVGQIADLTAWVKMGAPWAGGAGPAGATKGEGFDLQKRKREHWAWQPVKVMEPPAVKDARWVRDPIDAFVLAKLEEKGLARAGEADRRTLVRRVYFDLTGLPPSPEEVEALVADGSADAFEKVVDRLLASPRFGERWGRHWLDLVRYAETLGHEFDYEIANAWRYRDYVVRAFNADVPYDQFVIEHVAGDLLETPRRSAEGDNESIVGTGFWYLGEEVHSPVDIRQHQADRMDNRIDVFGKTFQGMTIACARCHDHKFDAISTADYYALYGYLKSTRQSQRAVNDQQIGAAVERLMEVKGEIRRVIGAGATGPATAVSARAGDVELAQPGLAGWRFEGVAFSRCGVGDFAMIGGKVTRVGGWEVAHGGLVSAKLEGAVRSPTFEIGRRYLHVLAAGQRTRLNVVIDNYVVIREPIYGGLKRAIDSAKPAWITIDLEMWKGHQAYVEVVDKSVGEPGGPGGQKDGWAAVGRVVFSDGAKSPGGIPETRDLAVAVDAALVARYRELEKEIPAPVYVPAACDGPGDDERVFIRGSPKNPGAAVPRRFLEALGASGSASAEGSGRLELARRIASVDNPLTARVMANRVWHHLFGRGLVASVDNFGVLGERPSHPELLDHLADRFVRDGWSVKRLIRAVVLTSAYRMSSRAADESAERVDPANVLLHRQNVRRLEAEAIRDAMLAVSARLDLTMGGPGVPVHITSFMEGRGRPAASGPLDGGGRRSLYVEVRRNFLPPMMLAFDAPIPLSAMGRRSVSNVPAQALIMMNDPFVAEQARNWAGRVTGPPRERVARMFEMAFGRPVSTEEVESVLAFVSRQAREYACDGDDVRVWTDVAHALLNAKEFIFVN